MSMGLANSLSVSSRGFLALKNVFWSGLVHMGGLDMGYEVVYIIHCTWMC